MSCVIVPLNKAIDRGRMPGVDRSEHERLSKRFNQAKELFEGVLNRKGPWLRNRNIPNHYSDRQTVADLEASLRILAEIRESLRHKSQPDEWLLHVAGTHWQNALALFLLKRYDEAASEDDAMLALIPQVPKHMWTAGQDQLYQSNYYFRRGELAMARGEGEQAIACFQESRRIDIKQGNDDGIRKCNEYLQALGSPPTGEGELKGDLRRLLVRSIAFLTFGFGSALIAGHLTGINVWTAAGPKAVPLFVFSAAAAVLADRLIQRVWR